MGKSVRDGGNGDPYVLDDQDVRTIKPKGQTAPTKAAKDPFVLDEDDKGFVKKKAAGQDSGGGAFPTPSGLPSDDTVKDASVAYADKKLTVQDQDVLAKTDWGKQQGLAMPDSWKQSYVQAHNGPKTSELVSSVMNVLNTNYPKAEPGSAQDHVREQVFTSVQKGDVPAIQKAKSSIIDAKQQEILKIQNNPLGPEVPSGVLGAPIYAQSSERALSPEQQAQIKVLQDQINSTTSTLDAFTAHAIVNSPENQTQMKAELLPANTKYNDLTLAADNIGYQLEKTVGINKEIPNAKYSRTRAGLEAIMTSINMDVNDLMSQGMRNKNPALLKQAEDKIAQLKTFQTRYNYLDNQFPDVGVYKTARYIGDILAETKPNRLITTSQDVNDAAAIAEQRNPGFLQSHGKFVDVVAKSEGDWVGVKSGLVPQGGFIGGVKAGTESIGWTGAQFVASPFGHTMDQGALEQAQTFLDEPQMKGTSKAGVQQTKVVYDKESKAFREAPNESYGKWDFNSSMYSLGKAVPTLAQWIVLDKGIGGLAKGAATLAVGGANIAGEGIAAATNAAIGAEALSGYEAYKVAPGFERAAGLYGTTYVTSFDENRKLADNLIEDKSSLGDAKKNALANVLTLTTAGLFAMADFSPTKAVEAALSKSVAPDVMKLLEKSSWQDLSEEQTAKLMKDQIWPRVKAVIQAGAEGAKSGAKLGAISVIDQKIKDFAGLMVNPDKAKTSSAEDNLHTFVDQVLLMTLVGLPNMVSSGAFPHTAKDALYQSGVLAPQYIDRINERAAQGDLDQGQANKMIAIIKTMSDEIGNAQTAVNKDGLPLTTRQKRDVAVNNFRKRAAAMLEESGMPIGREGVEKEADENTDAVRQENSWRNMEESVPFQSARDVETGKHPGGLDDIDPDKEYSYQKGTETVTTTGAQLSDHLINGDYEQAQSEKTEKGVGDGSAESEPPETKEPGTEPEGKPDEEKKNVAPEALEQGRVAIEKAVADNKIQGVYASIAKANPEAFLKEVADQALGRVATGEIEGSMGDAEKNARVNYTDDVVDAAIAMFPMEEKSAGQKTVVIRHGQSEANARRRSSTDDTPLTKSGEKQATEKGKELAAQGYTDVLPSNTVRTRQTADKILEQTGGQLIENPKLSSLLKEWDPAGESIDQFADRMARARDEVGKLPEGTAVVAHGKVMAMLEALDKTDGDVEKAKKEFETTKVYGNTDTYIPSPKKVENGTEKRNDAQGRKEGSNRSPEIGKEGNGEHAEGGGPIGPQAAEKGNDEGHGSQGDVLKPEGAVATEGAAPSLPTRQSRINDLLDRAGSFNKLRKNNPEKSGELNKIRLEAKELGIKVDYAKGFAVLKDENNKKISRKSEETNQTKAKDFSQDNYSDKTKGVINDLLRLPHSLVSVDIPGFDGRSMSEAQKVNALEDIRTGNITNGAKAVYDTMERIGKEGFVEMIDPSTRQRVGVPLQDFLNSIRQEIKPLSDDQLVELNTMLTEDVFNHIFDNIFAEETQTPPSEQQEPENADRPTEQPPAGDTGEGTPPPGPSDADTGNGEPPNPPPPETPEVQEEKVTGIRNVVVNSERMDRSLDAVVKEARASFQDVWDSALGLVKSGEADPRSLVSSLYQDAKPKVSDIDNAMILMDRIDLTNQRMELLRGIEAAQQYGNDMAEAALTQRLDDVERKIQQNDEVADRTGQETARALSSRRMLATMDYTLSKMTADIRRFYPHGDVPSPLVERLAKIEKDHAELLRKYAEREEQWKAEQAEKVFHGEHKKAVERPPTKGKSITLKGKALADRLRSLRPKSGGNLQANIFGLPIAIYDTAIVTIANLVEAGAKLADAINEAVKSLTFETDDDRDAFAQHLLDFEGKENEKANTPEGMRANLVSEIVEKAKDEKASTLVKDNITPLRKLARSYINEGVSDLGDLVEKIHADLSPFLPDLTPREVRDAFSGYGDTRLETRSEIERQMRDLKKQGELVSQFEDVMEGLQPERKTKATSKASKKVQELKDALEKSMKDNGITWENPPRTKEEQAARALQSVKNRLKTEIDKLETQIKTGQAPEGRTPVQLDKEGKDLRAARDNLKAILSETDSAKRLSSEMRVKRLENSLQKQISAYDTAIREGTDPFKPKAETVNTPNLSSLRAKRNAIRELYRKLKVDNNPKATPQQIALEAYKDRISKRVDTLRRRVTEGDFEPQERASINKDAAALKLDLQLKSAESQFYSLKAKAEKQNRNWLQKAFDKLNAYKRFAILSGLPSLGKIGLAVVYRTVGTPLEELIAVPLRQIPGIRTVARLAPREGRGFRLGSEGAALREWAKADSYRDWLHVIKKGRGELDIRQGKYLEENPELLEFFGRVHASMKNFAKRSEFARSFETRMDYARRQGFDTSDEQVQLTAAADAYLDASRAIFMQDNVLTKEYFKMLKRLEADDSGWVSKVGAFLARFTMPIVKVPTNFIAETGDFALGAFSGTAKVVYNAITGQLSKLSPQEADTIMRSLKKGSIGLAMMAIGYMMPGVAGGFWQRGEKRDPDEPDEGEFKIGGMRISKWATHFPLLEAMQIGATLRRSYERRAGEKGEDPGKAVTGSVFDAAGGLLGEVPLFEQPDQLFTRIRYGEWDKAEGEYLKSLNPQLIQNVAAWTDRQDGQQVKRDPKSPIETVMTGFPGLREQVQPK